MQEQTFSGADWRDSVRPACTDKEIKGRLVLAWMGGAVVLLLGAAGLGYYGSAK